MRQICMIYLIVSIFCIKYIFVYVFDLYKGQNLDSSKKSLAFSLTFTSITRTLTDDEISVLFNEIIDKVKNTFNAEVRDR